MKKLMLIIALVLAGNLFVSAAENNAEPLQIAGIENGAQVAGMGTIMLKGDIWVIRVTNEDGIMDYCPMNLPQNFQKVGMVVKFSGTVKNISDTERLAGMPLLLSEIKSVR